MPVNPVTGEADTGGSESGRPAGLALETIAIDTTGASPLPRPGQHDPAPGACSEEAGLGLDVSPED